MFPTEPFTGVIEAQGMTLPASLRIIIRRKLTWVDPTYVKNPDLEWEPPSKPPAPVRFSEPHFVHAHHHENLITSPRRRGWSKGLQTQRRNSRQGWLTPWQAGATPRAQSRCRAALLFTGLGPGWLTSQVQSHPLGKAPLARLSL